MVDEGITVRYGFHVTRPSRRIRLREGQCPEPAPDGSVPRIARLLALAHHYRRLLDRGDVASRADLARLAGVTRARITQVMNLLSLAPDIQEAILNLPLTREGRDAVCERDLRPIVTVPEWPKQRAMWAEVPKPTPSGA